MATVLKRVFAVALAFGAALPISVFGYHVTPEWCWLVAVEGGYYGPGKIAYANPASKFYAAHSSFPTAEAALDAVMNEHADSLLGQRCSVRLTPSYGVFRGVTSSYTYSDGRCCGMSDSALRRQLTYYNEYGEVCETFEFYDVSAFSPGSFIRDINWVLVGPLCVGQSVVKLALLNQPPESGTTITSVEPGDTTPVIVARVYDQDNQVVPNVNVELKISAVDKSGGHHHGDNGAVERTGKLSSSAQGAVISENGKVLTGNTRSDGLVFTLRAPAVAGDIKVEARCTDGKNCKQEGPDGVWVGIKNLQPLQADPNYVLIKPNADQNHPSNHYVSVTTQEKIQGLAANYRKLFPNDPPLHLNDASLVRGGLFDLGANWSSRPRGHSTHRFGTDIDIRANEFYHDPDESMPTSNYVDLMNTIATRYGCNAQIHSGATPNEHFHLYCR